MPLMTKTLSKIQELERIGNALKLEEKSLELMFKKLKEQSSNGKEISESQFTEYRELHVKHLIKQTHMQHELNSCRLLVTLLNEKSAPRFSRIIIGSGSSATLVYQELPEEFLKINKYNPLLPPVISVNDAVNPHTWPKEGTRLMGQPAKVQTPQTFSTHSEDLLLNEGYDSTNPYNYVVAEDFNNALIATQTHLNMPTVSLKVVSIESKEFNNWDHPDCKHRLIIEFLNEEDKNERRFLYTDAIDLCAGLGDSTKLENSQIDPNLAEELIKNQSLVYAQDGADAKLKGKVLLYGGSAVNSAWATEILSGHVKTNAEIIGLVSRNSKSLEAISTLSRFISNACSSTLDLSVGVLKSVNENKNTGGLSVTFSAPEEHGRFKGLKEDQVIECDQLIVAIGQQAPAITKGLKNFEQCIYNSMVSQVPKVQDTPEVPLGTHSKDGCIIVWGTLGTLGIGLDKEESKRFNKKAEAHANTYPYETQAIGGIFRMSVVIPQMAKQLRAEGFFPGSKEHNSQRLLLSDINQATIEELVSLIDHPDAVIRKEYAEKICKLRSMIMDNQNMNAPGIQNMDQLVTVVPIEFLSSIRMTYFPFSYLPDYSQKEIETAPEAESTQMETVPKAGAAPKASVSDKRVGFFTPADPGMVALTVDAFTSSIEELNEEEDSNIFLPLVQITEEPPKTKEILEDKTILMQV